METCRGLLNTPIGGDGEDTVGDKVDGFLDGAVFVRLQTKQRVAVFVSAQGEDREQQLDVPLD